MRRGRRAAALALVIVLAGLLILHLWPYDPVERSVTLGQFPGAPAVDAKTDRIFIPNYFSTSVSMLDGADDTVMRTLTAGSNGGAQPEAVAVDTRAGRAFVATNDGLVSVFDAGTGALLGALTLGGSDLSLAVDERRGRLFVANADAGTVTMLDTRTDRVLRTVTTGAFPQDMAVDEQTDRVFVADQSADSVAVLDAGAGRVVRIVPLGAPPDGLLVSAPLGRVFVASDTAQRIAVLDAQRGDLLRTIALRGPAPLSSAMVADTHTAHLFIALGDQLRMLDARTGRLLHSVRLPSPAIPAALSPTIGACLVLTLGEATSFGRLIRRGSLVLVDARTGAVRSTVTVGVGPRYAALDDRHDRVLVINSDVNPNGSIAGPIDAPDPWSQHVPWLHRLFPDTDPSQGGNGSLTVLDAARL